MEGHIGYGLLWESQYDYTVTGNNEAGESTDGHRISHHDGTHTDYAGRQSDTGATTDDNTDPVSVTAHVATLNGTNIDEGHYEITHNSNIDANTVNIHVDGAGSNDVDVNLDDVQETIDRFLWTQTSGDDAGDLNNADTDDVDFDISNVHDAPQKSVTLNLHVETDYPTKSGNAADLSNGVSDGIGTHEHDEEITMLIDDEPNFDPVCPSALALRVGGNGLSVLTYDEFIDEEHNDNNDYDAVDQVWHVPHDGAGWATDLAALHFDGTSSDEDDGDIDSTPGEEGDDVITYEWSLITGAAAGFTFLDLNANGSYDFGEPIFSGGGEEIYYETDYGDVIAGGPTPDDLDGSEDHVNYIGDTVDSGETLGLYLPADVYILNLLITDPYGDTDDVSYVIGVSAERNDVPVSDAGADQEWYMNYEEDLKDIEMSPHGVSDSDHDPLVYTWSYSGPGTSADSQNGNSGDHFDDDSGFFWDVSGVYDEVANDQGLIEGEHTFTLTVNDAYHTPTDSDGDGEPDSQISIHSDSFIIGVYDEPAAVAVTDLRVTNPDEAFKHIEIAWEEGIHIEDNFIVDGTLIWTGDLANADYFTVYINGEARATYINDEDVEGETYTHLEPQLEAESDYTFVVESYNSDDRLGDDSSSDVDQRTHDRPTITVLNPNGAEIASFDGPLGSNSLDAYDVDISVTNEQFVSAIDVEFLSQDGWVAEAQGENGSAILYEEGVVRSNTQIISDGEEIHYGGKVRVTVTDVGNYNDVIGDPNHGTGVLDDGSVNVPEDSNLDGNKQ